MGGVYPRARGESAVLSIMPPLVKGLSPRTRGILSLLVGVADIDGSIPAHAGNPLISFSVIKLSRVYPRARGESLHMLNL